MSDYNIDELIRSIKNLRLSILKRKNINNWKRCPKETPEVLSKIINSFDRKINKFELFDSKTKKKYFEKLNEVFAEYYENEKFNKCSKYNAWINYKSTSYCNKFTLFSKKTKKDVENHEKSLLTFKEFKKSGLVNKYKF